jgi:hypothetical protein
MIKTACLVSREAASRKSILKGLGSSKAIKVNVLMNCLANLQLEK